jgi:hypothetical protein
MVTDRNVLISCSILQIFLPADPALGALAVPLSGKANLSGQIGSFNLGMTIVQFKDLYLRDVILNKP